MAFVSDLRVIGSTQFYSARLYIDKTRETYRDRFFKTEQDFLRETYKDGVFKTEQDFSFKTVFKKSRNDPKTETKTLGSQDRERD